MGELSLSKYQWGIESTRGTAVAATRVVGADIKPVPIARKIVARVAMLLKDKQKV
jgi:hypothetical protein